MKEKEEGGRSMKYVLILEEDVLIYASKEYPVKILGNYVTITKDKPKQIVIFEAENEIALAKFVKYFEHTSHQLIPIVDAKDYEEKIGIDQPRVHCAVS